MSCSVPTGRSRIPTDYLDTFRYAVRRLVDRAEVDPAQVIGIGIDFTACTMLPDDRRRDAAVLPRRVPSRPACVGQALEAPRRAARGRRHQPASPRELGQAWLDRYGGKISSEWFFPKALQILREAPGVYHAADRLIEAADWVVWQLTGVETRNNCTAGYKALWSAEDGFPAARRSSRRSSPASGRSSTTSCRARSCRSATRAGGLTERAAGWTGLRPGTAVAVANVDAHVSVPASTVTRPGTLVAIMGTSICHVVLADSAPAIAGMCGVVETASSPACMATRPGQAAVGDLFGWFVDNAVPADVSRDGAATAASASTRSWPRPPRASGRASPGSWRSTGGTAIGRSWSMRTCRACSSGMTLATEAPEIYRALIEATAFGTRVIIDAFEAGGDRRSTGSSPAVGCPTGTHC